MSQDPAALPPNTPFVIFGDDWGRHVSTLQHLGKVIAANHPVVWIQSIGHRVPTLTARDIRRAAEKVFGGPRLEDAPGALEHVDGGKPVAIIKPSVLPWHHWSGVHRWNTKRMIQVIRERLAELRLNEPPILLTGTPPSAGVVGHLGERSSIYFCMDDFLKLPGTSPHMIAPLEERLLAKVDAFIATAVRLVEIKKPRSGLSYYLPQGVNFRHFSEPRTTPEELHRLPRPIVGFAGGLQDNVDLRLVDLLARRTSGSVVLVGPVHIDVSALTAPNIHILGPRPYTDLPAYVQAFDVGIIPYVLNDHTRAVDPLKLLEYMAAGIPVVCTDLPEAHKYGDYVSIEGSAEGFASSVERALSDDRATIGTRNRNEARKHTWEARYTQFMRILGEVIELRRRSPLVARENIT